MTEYWPRRRAFLGTAAALAMTSVGFRGKAGSPTMPSSPVTLAVIDAGGALPLVQAAFEEYRQTHPQLVTRFVYTRAPGPELPAKFKAQQRAGHLDIDLVLGGTDVMSAGVEQGLWVPLFPDYQHSFPDLKTIFLPGAWAAQELTQGQGLCVTFSLGGPLLEYDPARVKVAPTTPQELLDWTRQNPNRFLYARPANSGPGRMLLQGLPYVLDDQDPRDPVHGWEKTWSYLQELGKNIEYYPAGTANTMKELGQGARDMIVTSAGWDINPRALGIVPKETEVVAFKGIHWITDMEYLFVPKGIDDTKFAVLLDLMGFMLSKPAQAYTYDKGYFYPGPAVKDVSLQMAPEESQKVIREFGRPLYESLGAQAPKEVQLSSERLVYVHQRWDQQIGNKS